MTWTQNFNPLGNIFLSAAVAATPIVVLLVSLAFLRLKGWKAGLLTVATALLVAVAVYGMPLPLALASTVQGAFYGLFPICWIVITAVFLYNITVHTGQFAIIKDSIASITEDRRLQGLLIGFSFGAFLEGSAGFGTPVAISAGMLVGLGFEPLYAAGLCLIANTAPVAFGAIGIPIIVAGQVTGIDDFAISAMVGRQLPFLSLLVPFYLVLIMSGWKGVKEVWPAALVSGGAFALGQFLSANYLGPMLPDIISSLLSIVCLVAFLKVWKPKTIFRFQGEAAPTYQPGSLGFTTVLRAWSPFILLTVLVADWGMKPVKALLDKATYKIHVPIVDKAILNPDTHKAIDAIYKVDWLAAAGTAIFLACVLSAIVTRLKLADAVALFSKTLRSLVFPIITISSVLGFAYIGNSSGITTTLGKALASTGALFPLFSPLLGWLGVFITGSDTSANAIFGKLQQVSAVQLAGDPTTSLQVLTVAANSSGGVTGKMLSPQSIAVACAATGMVGRESEMLRFTFKHSLLMVTMICLLTYLQATVLRFMVPDFAKAQAASAAGTGSLGAQLLIATAVFVVALLAAVRSAPRQAVPVTA